MTSSQLLIACIVGLFGGVTSSLFGVGGGIVMVPAMVLLLNPPIGDIKVAVGTSLAVIVPTALMGAWRHATHQYVDWKVALALAPAAIAGSYLGAWLMHYHIPAESLRRIFGGLVILVGARLLLGR